MVSKATIAAPDDEGPDQLPGKIADFLLDLIAKIPESHETHGGDPVIRAKDLIFTAAVKAAAISGGLALPPGPLGLATILPEVYAVWRVQAQLVADVAATFGKTAHLTRETMLYCLFKHTSAQIARDIVVRAGQRVLLRRVSLRAWQQMLRRVGVITTQRLIGRGISRWLPLIGAVGVAGYAYYDTRAVGQTARQLFESELQSTDGGA
jgi:hypothetical protein